MKRREVLLGTAGACVVAVSARIGFGLSDSQSLEAWLDEVVADSGLPRSPELRGRLADGAHLALIRLFGHIGDRGEFPVSNDVRNRMVTDLLETKIGNKPSYLTEYTEAAAVLKWPAVRPL